MEADRSHERILRELEEKLLQPAVRASAQAVADLLADEFVEFGSSGRIFDKKQMIAALQQEPRTHRSLLDFKTTILAPEVVLATYVVRSWTSGEEPRYSLRSSIWRRINGNWKIVFHQGTSSKGQR